MLITHSDILITQDSPASLGAGFGSALADKTHLPSDIGRSLVPETDSDHSRLFDQAAFRIHCLELSCNLRQRNFGRLTVFHRYHVPVLFRKNQFCCLCSHSRGKYTVIRTRRTASLRMSRNRNSYFLVCLFLYLFCQLICNRRIFSLSQFFFVLFLLEFCVLLGYCALRLLYVRR